MMTRIGLAAGLIALSACRTQPGGSAVSEAVPDSAAFSGVKLTLAAEEATSTISAKFSFANDQFKPGDQVELRYDIVRTPKSVKINCSALRGTTTVTLEGQGRAGTFSKQVDAALFASPVKPDPAASAKLDMHAMLNSGGPLRAEGCLVRSKKGGGDEVLTTATAEAVTPGLNLADDDSPSLQYAKICADRLGPIPAFSCLDESIFKVLPITQTNNGQKVTPSSKVPTCDYPVYLPTGGGYCKPWARIGRLTTGPDTQAAIVCRRYWSDDYPPISGVDDPVFNDVAIIQHNSKSGETCWFQALGVRYGARVPPPTEPKVPDEVKAEHPQAQDAPDFWLKPSEVANINCLSCHDADAWMHSPYVRQAVDANGEVWLPSSPRSKYIMLGGKFGFNNWPQVYSVTPTENGECVTCHRIGSMQGCEAWARDAGGETASYGAFNAKSELGKAFPLSHWMPTADFDTYDSVASWKAGIGEGYQALLDCCNVKRDNGQRILGMSGLFAAAKPRYGRTMSAEDMAKLEAAGCKIRPLSEIRD